MTPLCYSLSDAWHWAAFSGDYNPIHFDESFARAQGAQALSVHGMRALLDVKRFVSPATANAPFIRCSVRLRQPLWCGDRYQLQPDPKKSGAVVLTSGAVGQTCISCQIAPAERLPDDACVSQSTLCPARLTILQQTFAPLLPGAKQWHFLDALLFRHLIQDDALLRQESVASVLPPGSSLEALFARIPVVQTHQEVIFDARLLADWDCCSPPEPLSLEILPALVIGDLQQGGIARIAARTSYRNCAMINAITLKTGPAAV